MQISYRGYFEHLMVGLLLGGLGSYLIFKKTNNKIKSIVFGILITTLIGIFKEFIDPYFSGHRDKFDLIITFLGSVVGAVMVLSKKSSLKNDMSK